MPVPILGILALIASVATAGAATVGAIADADRKVAEDLKAQEEVFEAREKTRKARAEALEAEERARMAQVRGKYESGPLVPAPLFMVALASGLGSLVYFVFL